MSYRTDELDQLQARLDALREAEGTSPTGDDEPEPTEEELGAEALAKRLGQIADGSWLSFPA